MDCVSLCMCVQCSCVCVIVILWILSMEMTKHIFAQDAVDTSFTHGSKMTTYQETR